MLLNMINKLAREIQQNNVRKGFYEEEKNIGEMLALIHSEVSEALEADRKDHYFQGDIQSILNEKEDETFKEAFNKQVKSSFEDELADIMIRVMDLAAYKGVDLESHILVKMRYNALREYKHGKKY
jgi:NTP pyrophosphatase (non-canonical NTP hydrolase)